MTVDQYPFLLSNYCSLQREIEVVRALSTLGLEICAVCCERAASVGAGEALEVAF